MSKAYKGGGLPDGWEKLKACNVYAKPNKKDDPIKPIPMKKQGIWYDTFNAPNPVELWIFENGQAPKSLTESKAHPSGAWGYRPGADPGCCGIEDMWFFPPNAEHPKNFKPHGVWSFPS